MNDPVGIARREQALTRVAVAAADEAPLSAGANLLHQEEAMIASGSVSLVTPPTTIALLAADYKPVWHPTATQGR